MRSNLICYLLLPHRSFFLTPCLAEANVYCGLHHMERGKIWALSPSSSTGWLPRMKCMGRLALQFLGREETNPHPVQSDCTAAVQTQHAQPRTCWAGRNRRCCHTWARLPMQQSQQQLGCSISGGFNQQLCPDTAMPLRSTHSSL